MRSITKGSVSVVVLLAAACSQSGAASSGTGGATATTASPAPIAPAAMSAPAAHASSGSHAGDGMWSEEPFVVQTEKFGDAQKAFAAAKDAMLTKYYAAGLTEEDVYRAAVRGMVEDIDARMHKWNRLLSPAQVAEVERDLSGEIVGIGVTTKFDEATGHIDLMGVIAGSPAEKAGLQAHDTIVSVNGKVYRGKTEMDAVRDIRGKAGDPVTLSVLRDDKLLPFTIVRAPVVVPDERHFLVDGVGELEISMFTKKTAAEVKVAMDDFAAANVHAIVVDLRANGGGSFDDAVKVAELFLPSGTPIVTLERREGKQETITSKGTPPLAALPMVVLVNQETSSSGELLAGALSEERHARVVGTHTFGKWTVQSIDDLGNGYAIKYTTALFHTPSGKSYEGVGLTPDVEVDADKEQVERVLYIVDPAKRLPADTQLRTALSLLKQ
jgi:carboxyl-terminal processing protease